MVMPMLSCVRTTVTLDEDVVAALRDMERERGISFKEALNSTVRAGLRFSTSDADSPFRVRTFRADIQPGVDLSKTNRLLAELEDDELVRKFELGK